MKISDERGNAVIEFIAVGLIGQLLVFGFLVQLGSDFRSQLAAESIARQSLRSIQLTGTVDAGLVMAEQAANVFGLSRTDLNLQVVDQCKQFTVFKVKATVRTKSYEAKGFCLN